MLLKEEPHWRTLMGENVVVVVQFLTFVQLFVTPWTAACQASLSFTISQSLLKLMSGELVMSSNHLIFCHPLLLLPSIFPGIRVFSDGSALHIWWPKFWSFSFSISPSNEYSGLISFKMQWSCCFVLLGYWYMTSRVILHLRVLWLSWGAWQSPLHVLNLSSLALPWSPRSQVDSKAQQSQTDKHNYSKNQIVE